MLHRCRLSFFFFFKGLKRANAFCCRRYGVSYVSATPKTHVGLLDFTPRQGIMIIFFFFSQSFGSTFSTFRFPTIEKQFIFFHPLPNTRVYSRLLQKQIALEFCIRRRGKMRARLCDRHQMSAAVRHVDGIVNVLENGQTSAGLAAIDIQT